MTIIRKLVSYVALPLASVAVGGASMVAAWWLLNLAVNPLTADQWWQHALVMAYVGWLILAMPAAGLGLARYFRLRGAW